MNAVWFEYCLDQALRAEICAQRLAALKAEYMPKRQAFDHYLYRNGPRVECPEFYADDFRILSCAQLVYAKSADESWEFHCTEDDVEAAA